MNDMTLKKRILWLTLFSVAMGFLEGAVVVYLRELYYPHGFSFPLISMNNTIALVEVTRELATIIMLLGVGLLGGRTSNERLAFFVLAFAIWDFFYYVFLKLVLDWPKSLMEWDILFLIPVPWIGPVITPLLITFTMVLFAIMLLRIERGFSRLEWLLIAAGCVTVIASWTIDFQTYAQAIGNQLEALGSYVPLYFPWIIFIIGEALLMLAVFLFWRRNSGIHTTKSAGSV